MYSNNLKNQLQSNQQQIDKETKQELEEAFRLFDLNNTGKINARELKAIMNAFGLKVKKENIRQYYAEINRDPTKDQINEDEFFKIMLPRLGDKNSDEQIQRVFKIFDQEGKGAIFLDNLKEIANQMDPQINDDELNEMFDEADLDQDGVISYEEFYKVMKRNSNLFDDLSDDEED